ncbi:agmatinase [Anaerovorax odorimutans]|uniref:Agmatinase n=1 Tax=Anaerovorax odorimutans TaxID=109327 RepID=A0ABT1RM93_9FIRM|nr:agmatinase [Anaerovorax odorimutans]MCQ4636303.1 agmatinase [Anaerovorax odorimutans]
MKKYIPLDSLKTPRFAEIKTFMRLPNVKTTQDIDYAVIGVPFDTGTTYRPGARFGPAAIRDISSLIKPYNVPQKVNVVEELSGVDYGDVPVIPGFIEETYEQMEQGLTPIVEAGVIPICLGGDHSITLGELRAIAKVHGPVALVHFDSHFDTIDSYFGKKYNHGTVFKRALEEGLIDVEHSIQVGMRGTFYSEDDLTDSSKLGFKVITSFEMRELGLSEVVRQILERVGDKKAFLTFDIDFVDPAFAPGTGTIEVGGFSSAESLGMVRKLKDLNFVGYDLVEVLPAYDPSQITAFLAANLVFEFISIIALSKKK